MRIIVIGAGAIGSLYGAKLARENDVTLIGRAEHVNAINAQGLRLEGLEPRSVRIQAATSVDHIDPDTLILLTTKVPDTEAALAPITSLVRDDTIVISLQNGLGSEELARDVLGAGPVVLRGITQFGAIFVRPGVINYTVQGHTLLEEHERSPRLATVLNAAGLDCRISPDIVAEVWRKLIFNCVVNPITTILGCRVGGIANPELRPLKQLLIEECRAVAEAEGVSLQIDFLREIDAVYGSSPNIVSMRQDLQRGRRTEIDYLNGAVAARSAKNGIPCPVNRALTDIIKAMERANVSLLPEKMLEPDSV